MSFGDIAAQALSGVDGEEDVEKQIEQALSCPCVGETIIVHLRSQWPYSAVAKMCTHPVPPPS